jgi:hypothetical protein
VFTAAYYENLDGARISVHNNEFHINKRNSKHEKFIVRKQSLKKQNRFCSAFAFCSSNTSQAT